MSRLGVDLGGGNEKNTRAGHEEPKAHARYVFKSPYLEHPHPPSCETQFSSKQVLQKQKSVITPRSDHTISRIVRLNGWGQAFFLSLLPANAMKGSPNPKNVEGSGTAWQSTFPI